MSNNNSTKNQKNKTGGSYSIAARVLCFVLAGLMVAGVAVILLEKLFGLF